MGHAFGPISDIAPAAGLGGGSAHLLSLSALAGGRPITASGGYGVGSHWLHDDLTEGNIIEIAASRGSFCMDETSTRPMLLLAGSVGQTPLLAILHRLATTQRRVWFVHPARNGQMQALHAGAAQIAAGADMADHPAQYLRPPLCRRSRRRPP